MNMLNEIKSDYLRIPLVLNELQVPTKRDKTLSSLTALNKLISSSQEEMEFLYKSDGINVIINFLKRDNYLTNICLKILANASKRHEKIRMKLLNNNIFHLLAIKLKNELDFTKSNLILYSALIVLLVQGNYEAQNQMRASGCLSSIIHILSCILDEAESKPLPCKSAELIIYTIIASSKDPRQFDNQTEIGWLTPKILKYLGKQTHFSNDDHLQITKCLWLLLKCALDKNDANIQIFLKYSGLSVLFRSIQDVVDGRKCEEMGDLLIKITGILIKLKSHKGFLSQACNYCPMMILCRLLKSSNSLVVQQVIIFLDSLTREMPQALQIIKDEEVLKVFKRAELMLLRCQSAGELCKNLFNRMGINSVTPLPQEDLHLSKQFGFTNFREKPIYNEVSSELQLLKNYFCVVHDVDSLVMTQNYSTSLFDSFDNTDEIKNQGRGHSQSKIELSPTLGFYRKEFRRKNKSLRKVIQQKFCCSPRQRKFKFNFAGLLGGKITQICQKFCSFF